jgi:hypothetical protein
LLDSSSLVTASISFSRSLYLGKILSLPSLLFSLQSLSIPLSLQGLLVSGHLFFTAFNALPQTIDS